MPNFMRRIAPRAFARAAAALATAGLLLSGCATRRVIAAFQMHYRPSNYDGIPDAETAAIMMAMK